MISQLAKNACYFLLYFHRTTCHPKILTNAIRFQMCLLLLVIILLNCIIHIPWKQSLFTSLGFWAYVHDLVIKENTKSLSSLVCTSHCNLIPSKWHIVPNDQLNLDMTFHTKNTAKIGIVYQFRSFNDYDQEIKHALALQCECIHDKFLPLLNTKKYPRY